MFQFGLFSTHLPYLLIAGIYFFGMISVSLGPSPSPGNKPLDKVTQASVGAQEIPVIVIHQASSTPSQVQSQLAIMPGVRRDQVYIFFSRAYHAGPECPGILPGYLTRLNGRAPPTASC